MDGSSINIGGILTYVLLPSDVIFFLHFFTSIYFLIEKNRSEVVGVLGISFGIIVKIQKMFSCFLSRIDN